MKHLTGQEEIEAKTFLKKASEVASNSTCERSKCGSLIVFDNEVIGKGFNSPPKNLESQKRCSYNKEGYHKKVTDKTCCIHAEQRAILDALKNNPSKIQGSKLYFIRLGEDNSLSFAAKPYCTICSKLSLEIGIKEFILWHKEGVTSYDTEEYNLLSFKYE